MDSWEVQDELNCAICLSIYKVPVTLRCGHSFCRECIERLLNSQEKDKLFRCPTCRKKFSERPVLQKNYTLCNITQRCQEKPSYQPRPGVICTYCIQSTVPAVRHCSQCEAYLCVEHTKAHSKSLEHTLYTIKKSTGVAVCPDHRRTLKYYCAKHDMCICSTCRKTKKHRNHQTIPIAKAHENKKESLRKYLQTMIGKSIEIETKIQAMKKNMTSVQKTTSRYERKVSNLVKHLAKQITDMEAKFQKDIEAQRDKIIRPLSNDIHRLHTRVDQLYKKRRRIMELCNMDDAIVVVQEKDISDHMDCHSDSDSDDEQEYKVQTVDEDHIASTICSSLLDMVNSMTIWFSLHPPLKIILDENTAAYDIQVDTSENSAHWTDINPAWPSNPERFQEKQIISSKGVSSGKHYWDVQVGGFKWRIGMCYPSIARSGEDAYIGNNAKSWCICIRLDKRNFVMHDGAQTLLPHSLSSRKMRICLDYDAGKLSFLDSENMKLLHTFTANFTEPLYAAFYLGYNESAKDWIKLSENSYV